MPETLFNIKLNIHDFDSVLETTEKFYDSEKLNTIYFLNAHCLILPKKIINTEIFSIRLI
jgi:hypothetical protein